MDDLLDVSRVTPGLIELDREPVDPMAIVASAVEQLLPLDGHPRPCACHGWRGAEVLEDCNRLVQMFVNQTGRGIITCTGLA